jgi:hypothetical protein
MLSYAFFAQHFFSSFLHLAFSLAVQTFPSALHFATLSALIVFALILAFAQQDSFLVSFATGFVCCVPTLMVSRTKLLEG